LYEYDDFMSSIQTLIDLGCGGGDDLEWWATRTTRGDNPRPLNIQCTGVDQAETFRLTKKYSNVFYQRANFEAEISTPKKSKFDVLWCHDAFQYCINPLAALRHWYDIASDGAMLVLAVPQTFSNNKHAQYWLPNGSFYHHSMVSLIYMLATTGWDCRAGFFLQQPTDCWIHAVVYKSEITPMDPKTTTWYHLSELKLLPESSDQSIQAHGYLRQQDLIVPWLDKSFMSMSQL